MSKTMFITWRHFLWDVLYMLYRFTFHFILYMLLENTLYMFAMIKAHKQAKSAKLWNFKTHTTELQSYDTSWLTGAELWNFVGTTTRKKKSRFLLLLCKFIFLRCVTTPKIEPICTIWPHFNLFSVFGYFDEKSHGSWIRSVIETKVLYTIHFSIPNQHSGG